MGRAAKGRQPTNPLPWVEPADARAMAAIPFELSREASFVETPCLGDEFVGRAHALSHPGLAGPVAYLAGFALTPLLRDLPPGRTLLEIARSWTDRMPLESGLAIAAWLINHRILVGPANRE